MGDKKNLFLELIKKRNELEAKVDEAQAEINNHYTDTEIISKLINDVKGLTCSDFDHFETFGSESWYCVVSSNDLIDYDFSTILPQIKHLGYYISAFYTEEENKKVRIWFNKISEVRKE